MQLTWELVTRFALETVPHQWRESQCYQVPTCPSELGSCHGSDTVLLPHYLAMRAHVCMLMLELKRRGSDTACLPQEMLKLITWTRYIVACDTVHRSIEVKSSG